MSYQNLTQDERYQIDALFGLDLSCPQIAAQLEPPRLSWRSFGLSQAALA